MCVTTAFPIVDYNSGALIASPSSMFREQILRRLNGRWRYVQYVLSGAEALAKLEEGDWRVLFLDRRLADLDSAELSAIIQRRFPEIQLVLLDSDAAFPPENVGKTRQEGPNSLVTEMAKQDGSWGSAEATKENESEKYTCEPLPGMIGHSEAMQRVYRLAKLVAPRTTTVLLVGPTGSGKELVARALHTLSPRASGVFVVVNCAAIPEALFESELFGHARGAFTGAVQPRVGLIPSAHGGTLFLDEVSELPFGMQAKLLRSLEQKEVQRLGTSEMTRVDVRVIAASNVDLAGRAGRGEFREDLFYRLSVFPLKLPPLTERRIDIVPLAEHFLAYIAAATSGPCPQLSAEAIRILEAHPWKGNVRELRHVMERASILVQEGHTILTEHLYFPFQNSLLPSGISPLSYTSRGS
jgi:DNA-binding NtrC family response regulator